MALHARLSAPPPTPKRAWPWHSVASKAVPVTLMSSGDRRLEAEMFLADGFSIKVDIESRRSGWDRLSEMARVWMPGRLKGIQVGPDVGTPFLTATQMFDTRPISRKWLAVSRTPDADNRFVKSGQILVTCSGAVGRTTVALSFHENTLISHDILRVDPEDDLKGWVYAFLLSSQSQAMATGSHYGHIIKHLETSHLDALPVPRPPADMAKGMNDSLRRVISLREKSNALMLEAEAEYAASLGGIPSKTPETAGFVTRSVRSLAADRRRLEAAVHNPTAESVRDHLRKHSKSMVSIEDAGFDVWLPMRFKRVPVENGVPLLNTSDLGAVKPQPAKHIKDGDFGDPFHGRIKGGWILVPRSGQVYGILGTPTIALSNWEEWVVSDDALRVRPAKKNALPTGYVATALGHPKLGRPIVKALAYGSSIPHIDPVDLASLEIPRLGKSVESSIAMLAESSAQARQSADIIETSMSGDASEAIEQFCSGRGIRIQPDTHQAARGVLSSLGLDD